MAQIFHFHAPSQRKNPDTAVASESAAKKAPRLPVRKLRFAIYALVLGALFLLLVVEFARAGGPEYVAGVSYFDAGLAGHPVTWMGGAIHYYTDQGDLSSILHGPDADAFVADAFSRWSTVSTAAVSSTRAGQLAEDVVGEGSHRFEPQGAGRPGRNRLRPVAPAPRR